MRMSKKEYFEKVVHGRPGPEQVPLTKTAVAIFAKHYSGPAGIREWIADFEAKEDARAARRAATGLKPKPRQHVTGGKGSGAKRRGHILRLIMQHGPHCQHCGTDIFIPWVHPTRGHRHPSAASFDHEITKTTGGTYHYQNGILSCHRCNQARADLPLAIFRVLLRAAPALGATYRRLRQREAQRMGLASLGASW